MQNMASKKDLKEASKYLENIDPNKVEAVFGVGKYTPWHGDGKSQSKTNIIFQTKSIKQNDEVKYVTEVTKKNGKDYFVKHESDTWEKAEDIIDAMVQHLPQ